MNSLYFSAVSQASLVAADAGGSIGEAMTTALRLGGDQGEALRQFARDAFSDAHGTVLLITGVMIAVLAVAVFMSLRGAERMGAAKH